MLGAIVGSRAVALFVAIFLLTAGIVTTAPTARGKDVGFAVEMNDVRFTPDVIRVDLGDVVTIRVLNNETANIGHTFDITEFNVHIGTRGNPLPRGAQGNATFTADRNGTFWYFCDIPGHAIRSAEGSWSGMAGRLIVGEELPPTNATPNFVIILAGIAVIGVTALIAVYVGTRKK